MFSSRKRLKGRTSHSNCYYSVTLCCENRVPIFANYPYSVDAAKAIYYLEDKVETICFVLMPDHLHWIFQLRPQQKLSAVIKLYKSMVTMSIRKRKGRKVVVWQSNFYDHQIRDENDLIHQARYVVANPLRAKLVKHVGDYPFWNCIWL
ncbi:transposase [Pseudoalteromonas shioyasakiensis]|uniref:REP-associated tyrosine transposase n=1 Tax=Pseudoalteromonas shioyasakiensis TaxID=1190813 RepID=UPI0021186BB8|nr:transposase [Pseudoalteromonas shioyasakiensis]MCQ8881277.1 transposase [Pseudoalteromonas shioyasakiensis]